MTTPAYPVVSANTVIVWGRWYDHLTRAGRSAATITATPKLAQGQLGGGNLPNQIDRVDQAEIKLAPWKTKPLATGLWAYPAVSNNDLQLGAFGGWEIAAGEEAPFLIEVLENALTMQIDQEMVDALTKACTETGAAPHGLAAGTWVQAVWVRDAAVLPTPAVAPPAGVLTSAQVVDLIAGVRQLPPSGTPGQMPTPKSGGGYEWVTPQARAAVVDPIGLGDPADQVGGIPRVTIDTAGRVPVDSLETYRDATITISGAAPYSGTTQIRGRGNSTWGAAKKPYRLKLTAEAALLGMPSERDWVLLANYYDPLSIRNALALALGARCPGLAWTPRSRFVELVLNGTLMGLYQLVEQVELSPQRISAIKASGTGGLTVTGAYSMEIDQRLEQNNEPGFRTATKGIPILLDDPDGSTAEQKTYIQQWINNFEAVLFGSSWLDPATGYARFIDRASFIDWYLVNELVRNQDSTFYSSVKLVKTRDTDSALGRLYLGPLWDFDNSLNNNFGAATPATGFWTRDSNSGGAPGAVWIKRMFDDPAFFAALVARWAEFRTAFSTGDSIYAIADRLTDRLTFAVGRDKRAWSRTIDVPAGVDALKAWLKTRTDWLSTQLLIDTTAPSVPAGLTGTPGNGQNGLTWSASTDNVAVAKYRVYRDGTMIAEPSTTTFLDTGRTNGTSYSYQVSALDAAGNESAKTAAVAVTPAGDTTAPTTPTSLMVTPGNAQNVLTWGASTDNVGVVKYRVRRGGTVVAEPTATSYTDTGLTNGTAYAYTVSALDAAGNESTQTTSVSGTPVAASGAAVETFTGSDGAAWPTGWTFQNTTGTINNNKGRLAGSGDRTAFQAGAPGLSGDFDERFTVALPTAANVNIFAGVGAAQRNDILPANGYIIVLDAKSTGTVATISLNRVKAAGGTYLQQVFDLSLAASATGWTVRLQRAGTTLRAKVWAAGATEPSTWQINVTDNDMPTGPFKPHLGIRDGVTADFDDVSFA